jgi:gluconolactonase
VASTEYTMTTRRPLHCARLALLGAVMLPATSSAAPPMTQQQGPNDTPLMAVPANGGQAAAITPFVGVPVVTELVSGLTWAEGPMWNPGARELVFTDLSADRIHRLRPDGTTVAVSVGTGNFANGIEAGVGGSWVVCEHATQRVRRRVGNTWTTLASTWQGLAFNSPNDNVTGMEGSIYFTDPTFGSLPEFGGAIARQPYQGVYRIAPDGVVHLVDDALQQPNGIALDRSGTRLYVTDTTTGAIMRYPVASDGSTGAGVQIANVPQPDGMTVDRSGYLYIAAADGVRVLRSTGAAFGTFAVPQQPSNVAFGGVTGKRLFITARTSVYSVDLRLIGVAPPA